jgi:hypothetical protein
LAERDKIEPFWARPSRKRRASPELVVPTRDDGPAAEPTSPPPPAGAPQEPSFPISRQARRDVIAGIVNEAAPPESYSSSPAAADEPRSEPSLGRAPPEAPPPPDAHGWIRLSPVEAARHPLYGVRGWLVLIAILIALGLARALVELLDFWATIDHGGLAAWIMAVLRSAMALWAALLFGLLLSHSRAFPTGFAAYGMVNVIYLTLFGLAFAHVTHNRVFAGVAVGIAVNLLAIAYVLRSRRVNVTFRRRVRAKKAATETSAPPAGPIEASPA